MAKQRRLSPDQLNLRAAEKRAAERVAARNPETWGANRAALSAQADVVVKLDAKKRVQTARRKTGIDWLWSKGRLNTQQMSAALLYGDDYRAVYDVHIRSCADDSVRGGDPEPAQERREKARCRLERARRAGLLGHQAMITMCDQVVGEGKTIRELSNGTELDAQHKEAQISIALDLLSAHYGV